MTEFFEEEQMKLPSLWRMKAQAYMWTVLFAVVFFTVFYTIRQSITVSNPFNSIIPAEHWTMITVFLATAFSTLLFNKAYYWLNPEAYQNDTKEVRLMRQDIKKAVKKIEQMYTCVKQINDVVITYADKIPSETKN